MFSSCSSPTPDTQVLAFFLCSLGGKQKLSDMFEGIWLVTKTKAHCMTENVPLVYSERKQPFFRSNSKAKTHGCPFFPNEFKTVAVPLCIDTFETQLTEGRWHKSISNSNQENFSSSHYVIWFKTIMKEHFPGEVGHDKVSPSVNNETVWLLAGGKQLFCKEDCGKMRHMHML